MGVLAMLCAAAAVAQGYPNKAVRMVVPAPPGGGLDLIARIVGQKMSDGLKQNLVVENRPGANDVIGTDFVAKSAPDGYTVLLAAAGEIAVLPHLQKLPYNVDKDLAPVSLAVIIPLILVVHPSVPAKTVKELIAFAKARPGQISYASAGTGGAQHLAAELLKISAKIDLLHVPYKGGGPAILDLVGGQVSMFFSGGPAAMPFVAAGRLRPLAVTTAARSPAVPAVPTMIEAGVPDFVISNWLAYFVPAGTPPNIVARLNTEIVRALKLPDVKSKLADAGAEVVGSTAEELADFVRAEGKKFAWLITQSGAKGTD
ncbi:MAG: tripartite tricarboxylate transporter substrate binding protein [Betaproteobacteria bacterium]|nr:tripartite tricarboxylate transporter substrate binding protein [Betaproteobacteria bacterium]